MSRIYKKTSNASSSLLSGIAFGGGGGGGGNNGARRSVQARREAQYGNTWSDSTCDTLGDTNAVSGTVSFVSGVTPGGQAVSLAAGLVSAAGTAIQYNNCD
ncbi:hypothetical protein [Marinomonas algicola]|uniref:hypothetical protein n=1 Tax=Marinomonas algicola TaxID=2773454 RepID=UPI00174CAB79|nr:hypothetical protein [Marinomonas algicola]